MAQNFDQAERDNTFWPMPNILKGSVPSFPTYKSEVNWNQFCMKLPKKYHVKQKSNTKDSQKIDKTWFFDSS